MSSNAILFKPYKILKSALASTPIREGQFILCIDAKEIYLDKSDTERIKLDNNIDDIKNEILDIKSDIGNINTILASLVEVNN